MKIREEIIKKWKESGLLDGLHGQIKPEVAKLYECCKKTVINEFLTNRDETGREIVTFPETNKKYYVEYIEPRGWRASWGDLNPATKKIEGQYGAKFKGSINENESVIKEENGFKNIIEGSGSPYDKILELHNKWKKENGYN